MSREKTQQIFIAKLSTTVREKDLDYEFKKFGTIKNIQIKRGYAFIEYEDYKDADEAIKEMDGRKIDGQRIVVQQARGRKGDRDQDRDHDRSRDRNHRYRSRDRDRFSRRGGPQSDDICYNCGKTGHWANECRDPVKPKGQYFKDDSRCFKCLHKGHHEKDCKSSSRSRSKRSRSRSRSRSDSRRRERSRSRSGSRSRSRSESENSRIKRRERRRSESSKSSRSEYSKGKDNKKEPSQNGKIQKMVETQNEPEQANTK